MDLIAAPSWRGELVGLRPLEPSDATALGAYELDSEEHRLGGGWASYPWSRHRLEQWLAEPERSAPQADAFSWAIEVDAVAVGVINTHHCQPRAGNFAYGVRVMPEHRRRGYAREAIRLLLRYHFEELRYQKCTITIYDFNVASIALHESLGFVHEGRMRRTVFTAGRFYDEIVFGITAEEFAGEREPGA